METVHNMFQEILFGLIPQAAPLAAKATPSQILVVQLSKTTTELPTADSCTITTKMALASDDEVVKKCAPNEKIAEEMRTHFRRTREDGQVPVLMMARDGYSKLFGLMLLKEGERN